MLKSKMFKLYMLFRLDLGFLKDAKKLEIDFRALNYYRRKYSGLLKKSLIYNGTGEHSNKVWWCWLQGEDAAPELCKACLSSIKKELKNREIIVVTLNNYRDYVELPDYIVEKYKSGCMSGAHFSDILRLQLLIKYGGTWIDSSVLCTGFDEDYFDKDLFVFSNCMRVDKSSRLSNWFITSEKNNPILCTTRDLLFEYWKRHNYAQHYFIFHLFFTLACEKYPKVWQKVRTVSNVPPHILQFELLDNYSSDRFSQIKKMSSIHKLSYKIVPPKDVNSNYDFVINMYRRGRQ